MSEKTPRVPVMPEARRPTLSLQELEAVVAHRSALRHWRGIQLDLARLERASSAENNERQRYATRSAEVRAAARTRETRKVMDEVLMGES